MHRIVGPIFHLLDQRLFSLAGGFDLGLGLRLDLALGEGSGFLVDEQFGVGLFGIDHFDRQILHLLGIGNDVVFEFIQQRVVQGIAPSRVEKSTDSGSGRVPSIRGADPIAPRDAAECIFRVGDSVIQGAAKSSRQRNTLSCRGRGGLGNLRP
jgi:hypothetical protein